MRLKFTIFSLCFIFIFSSPTIIKASYPWSIRSVDTMKDSRDKSEEYLNKSEDLSILIDKQVAIAKKIGANYIAIGTPYDEKYLSIIKQWASTIHKEGLNVWYRGNWSGWEGWNNYPKNLTITEHIDLTRNFILKNNDLFKDGDSFTSCPECEYGGPGNPLNTGDIQSYQNQLISEYKAVKEAFTLLNKNVHTNWISMNPDVAKAVLNNYILNTIDNIITLDYFVDNKESLEEGLQYFSDKFPNAQIILGEYGAPIPELNGNISDQEQSIFIDQLLNKVVENKSVIGVNYWVLNGGSTSLLKNNSEEKPAISTLKNYYNPFRIQGVIKNTLQIPIPNVKIQSQKNIETYTNSNGKYNLILPANKSYELKLNNNDYKTQVQQIETLSKQSQDNIIAKDFILEPKSKNILYFLKSFFSLIIKLFNKIKI